MTLEIDKLKHFHIERTIDCVEVEISPDNWIMSVDADNTDLLILSCNYSIQ